MTDDNTAASVDADVASARRLLGLEAEGIRALSTGIGAEFSRAVDILLKVNEQPNPGRVIVSGMGKSGHIANKIAATMASTGTPAHFVHPAEASHGDLGMITAHDAVICLSNSGETAELSDLIGHTRRFGVPLIAIVSRMESTLGHAADVVLLLPSTPEACPLGLAPTTSTTMMLALGDALAVALLERRGFTPEQFQVLHPGGKLGKKLVKVRDIMHAGDALPLVERSMGMRDALLTMTRKSFGCIGVVDDRGRIIGIVTDGDLRRHIGGNLLDKTVADIMTANPKTIRPDKLAGEAVGRMNAGNITALFVVEDETPVGIIHIHDCLRAGVA